MIRKLYLSRCVLDSFEKDLTGVGRSESVSTRRSSEGLYQILTRSSEGLNKVFRKSSEGLQEVFRRSSEGLNKVFRRSSEGLQEVFRSSSEDFLPSGRTTERYCTTISLPTLQFPTKCQIKMPNAAICCVAEGL